MNLLLPDLTVDVDEAGPLLDAAVVDPADLPPALDADPLDVVMAHDAADIAAALAAAGTTDPAVLLEHLEPRATA